MKRPTTRLDKLPDDGWLSRKAEAKAALPIPTMRGSDWAKYDTLPGGRMYKHSRAEWYVECQFHGMQAISAVIEIDPSKRGGVPVMCGTRFTVSQVLAELAETSGVEQIAEDFDLEANKIRDLLNGMSLMLNKPYVMD